MRFEGQAACLLAAASALFLWQSPALALSPRYTEQGNIVRWTTPQVGFVLDESLHAIDPQAVNGAALAIQAWTDHSSLVPQLSSRPGAHLAPGYSADGPNTNAILYAAQGWAPAKEALAVTVLTFQSDSGVILDADIVVNGGKYRFGVLPQAQDDPDEGDQDKDQDGGAAAAQVRSTQGPTYDLQNVLTHEVGHALGLPEDPVEQRATMFTHSSPGETRKRTLFHTDVMAVDESYQGEPAQLDAEVGCGAKVAAGKGLGARAALYWLIGLLALGLGLRMAKGRRKLASGLLAALAATLIVPPLVPSVPDSPRSRPRPSVHVTVTQRQVHWNAGLLVSRLWARVEECHGTVCPQQNLELQVFGGQLGPYTQQVGAGPVPSVGSRLRLEMQQPGPWQPARLGPPVLP